MQKREPAHSIRVHPCCTALRRAHRQRTLADGNPDCAGLLCSLSHRIAPARLAACSSTTARQRGPVAPPADSLVCLPTRFIFSLALACGFHAQIALANLHKPTAPKPTMPNPSALVDRAMPTAPCRPRHAGRAQPVRASRPRPCGPRPSRPRRCRPRPRAAGARARANRSRAARCSCVRC